jgi:hypothetical protein
MRNEHYDRMEELLISDGWETAQCHHCEVTIVTVFSHEVLVGARSATATDRVDLEFTSLLYG